MLNRAVTRCSFRSTDERRWRDAETAKLFLPWQYISEKGQMTVTESRSDACCRRITAFPARLIGHRSGRSPDLGASRDSEGRSVTLELLALSLADAILALALSGYKALATY